MPKKAQELNDKQKKLVEKLYEQENTVYKYVAQKAELPYHKVSEYLHSIGKRPNPKKPNSTTTLATSLSSELEKKVIPLWDAYEGDYEKVARKLHVTSGTIITYLQDHNLLAKKQRKKYQKKGPYKTELPTPKQLNYK